MRFLAALTIALTSTLTFAKLSSHKVETYAALDTAEGSSSSVVSPDSIAGSDDAPTEESIAGRIETAETKTSPNTRSLDEFKELVDLVPNKARSNILQRLKLTEKILTLSGKAYDYKRISLNQLRLILQLEQQNNNSIGR